jgi:lysophospholipase L1-like esterase
MSENPDRDVVSGALAIASLAGLGIGLGMFLRSRRAAAATPTRCTAQRPCSIVAIGDSITAHPRSYATYSIPYATVQPMGVVGQGSAAILERLRRDVLGQGIVPDEVIIQAGINDVGRRDAASYIAGNLRAMVQEAKSAGMRVVLLTLTPYHEATSVIASVNRIIKTEGRTWGADAIVDVHRPLSTMLGHLKPELVGDRMGLHPNAEGHRLMAVAVLQQAYS